MSKRKPKKQIDNKHVEKVMLLMVAGMSQSDLEQAAKQKLGVDPADITSVIAAAKRKITLAADYNRDEQVGTAVTRLNDIYTRSIRSLDNRTALAAQKELSKMLDIYQPKNAEPVTREDAAAAKKLKLIEGHLLPLKLVAADSPIDEHARVAAEKIRSLDAGP